MTKEQIAYADTLNLLGSDVPDQIREAVLVDTLGREARLAAHSTGPHADCPRCYWTVGSDGPDAGEHFADLWEHLITSHHLGFGIADLMAQEAWSNPIITGDVVSAA